MLLARASDTGGELGVLGVLALEPMPQGRWVPAHSRHAAAEAWYVLEVELTFRFETRTETAPAGSFIFVPAGVVHEFGNTDGAPARFLEFVLSRPGALEAELAGVDTGQQYAVMEYCNSGFSCHSHWSYCRRATRLRAAAEPSQNVASLGGVQQHAP